MLELLIENLYYLGFMETNKSLFNCFYKADFVESIELNDLSAFNLKLKVLIRFLSSSAET